MVGNLMRLGEFLRELRATEVAFVRFLLEGKFLNFYLFLFMFTFVYLYCKGSQFFASKLSILTQNVSVLYETYLRKNLRIKNL